MKLDKIAKSRINATITEIGKGHITSELATFLKDRLIQKHGRWIIKK